MAENKTEEPTPRRLRTARREGDVPVSTALLQATLMLVTVTALPWGASAATSYFVIWFQQILEPARPLSFDPLDAIWLTALLVVPLTALAAGAALAVGLLQTGAVFVPARLVPDLTHLNPFEGLSKLFTWDRITQLARSLIAVAITSWLSFDLLLDHTGDLLASVGKPRAALTLAGVISHDLLWLTTVVSLGLAFVDFAVVRRSWLRKHRMSKDEIQREHKEAEGDPQLRQERRRAQREMLHGAMLNAVKNATVVIVNPTHLATALFYDEEQTSAPQVIAQGQGHVAQQIIDAARAYGVPVVRDIPTAQALRTLELGEEIPEILYEAVAEILRQVWSEVAEQGNEPSPNR